MSNIVRKVNFHGALTDYGESHEFAFDDFRQFASFVDRTQGKVNGKTYSEYLIENEFSVIVSDSKGNDETLTDETAAFLLNDKDVEIDIIPVIKGEKSQQDSGGIQTVIGTTLAVAGSITGNPILINIGIATLTSGITTLLAPTVADQVAEEGSSIYTGGTNETQAGTAIPLVFGDVMTGSLQVSFGLDVIEWSQDEEAD